MIIKTSAKRSLLAISMLALSTAAFSKEISYDFIQGTYSSITDSTLGVDIDGTGFSVAGSVSISPNIAFTALYGATSFDRFLGIDVDATEMDFGITAHTSIAPNTDVFGSFSVVNGEVEASDGFTTISDDDTGHSIVIGLRHMATNNVEIDVAFAQVDIFDDTSNALGLGARFYANEKFSVGVGYSTGDDIDTLLLNARVDFK